jgi:hypothetical protein
MPGPPEGVFWNFRILESQDEHFYGWEMGLDATRGGFSYHWPLNGLGLPDDVLKKVYGDNARRVFRMARENAARRPTRDCTQHRIQSAGPLRKCGASNWHARASHHPEPCEVDRPVIPSEAKSIFLSS